MCAAIEDQRFAGDNVGMHYEVQDGVRNGVGRRRQLQRVACFQCGFDLLVALLTHALFQPLALDKSRAHGIDSDLRPQRAG